MFDSQRLRHVVRRMRGRRSVESLVMRLSPERPSIGRMLLSYHTDVFERLLEGRTLHHNYIADWHGFQIARTFLDLGFAVDVIDFRNEAFIPSERYDVLVDVMVNLGRLAHHLDPSCRKFLHPHGAHWTVNNARTYARHAALAERRGVSLFPERVFIPNDSVERADVITCRGGEWGRQTFAFTSTPVRAVPQITPAAIDEFIERDYPRCRRRFVWLGGRGLVHKGLDLLLEAFAGMPDCHLTVCGNVRAEPLFETVYRHELWGLPNVTTLGYVDTQSDAFRRACADAIGMVIPSASELGCGSVIAGMMNGLIPIVTPSTDVDVAELGLSIACDTVEGIRDAIRRLDTESDARLAQMSRMAWEAVGRRYGRRHFLQGYRAAVCDALGLVPAREWEGDGDCDLRIPAIRRTRVWNVGHAPQLRVV